MNNFYGDKKMSRISQIIIDAVPNGELKDNFSNIITYLEQNDRIRWEIYREVERQYHKEDIQNEIDYYNEENDTNYTFTDKELDLMLEDYENSLDDCEEWHYILKNIIEKWIENE